MFWKEREESRRTETVGPIISLTKGKMGDGERNRYEEKERVCMYRTNENCTH